MTRDQILALLDSHVCQRSGVDYRNYGDVTGYRSDQRRITRHLHDYRALRAAVEHSSITAEQLRDAFRAFSGRLSLSTDDKGRLRLDYCTGQYFPTEYRAAACAVLAQVLWDYHRDDINSATADRPGRSLGDEIRAKFRRMFGRGIQSRWFD